MQKKTKELYGTADEQHKFVSKRGNIITFKEPIYPWGTKGESRKQIISSGLRKTREGHVKIVGAYYDSPWYNNLEELLKVVDWDWMREAHQDLPKKEVRRKGKGI